MVPGPYLTARMVSSHGLWYRACVPSGTQSWDLGPWTFPKDRASSTTKVGRNIGNAHQTPQLKLWPHSDTFKPWTVDPGPWTLDLGPWTLDLGPWTLDLGNLRELFCESKTYNKLLEYKVT
jgi:hypothetical protein